ncbi:CMRF35-like molecule 2 isoform X2 [Pteropus medius]|uniref:CMRF35-like molecule 2 isoform X2 n=1 Tax=Pteropus vampyrus TaxID=132908 RepID=UPI00196AE04D|nr:CMRF35-like molecule 2 isoform X2 [Pteropus giganteus]XP_039715598.1 CMRF35-like molecule 2 isoform X2 [Pteropus giganteus]XP_039715599.1 CMRF35-like molecule 2 isoform X2 [Pteropus giganteus]XP_039715600.1 CMRF35-like molecule 2 isoform X2 [Pteropus giganteus]XP_039715601.1 CMRF35-like molecule 2 isoform X2 [Pteropus giganteus]
MLSKQSPDYNVAWRLGQCIRLVSLIDTSLHGKMDLLLSCLSLTGPSFVTGTAGSSLTVRCRYDQAYKGYNKYWCRGEYDTDCHTIVETKGEEREERNGWVSIRDSADDLAFTVTMRNLDAADAGPYWCKIQTVWILDAWSRDPSFQVQVSVSPAPRTTTRRITRLTTPAAFSAVITHQVRTHHSGIPLSTVHFLFPIFLKLPLFLSMLGAVLYMSRRQRGPRGRWSLPDQSNALCRSWSPGMPCPGTPPFRLDRRDLQTLYARAGKQ